MNQIVGPMLVGCGIAVLLYTYIGYPIAIAVLASLKDRPLIPSDPSEESIAIVVSARNEQATLARRLNELTGLISKLSGRCEVIVVSDGSTDDTVSISRQFESRGVRTIEWTKNRGKAAAIGEAVRSTECPIVAFADARQRWSDETLHAFLEDFRDPDVGGVSGELVLEASDGVLAGVGAYWKYEKWIRKTESRLGSQIGVTGAIAAVRRECFRPIPDGTILDDVYWPMQVVLQGKRVIFEPRAKAYDRLPTETRGEFRRKVRTLAGNFQLVTLCPRLLLPLVNPVWIAFVSHKLLRLVCPWAMLGVAIGCVIGITSGGGTAYGLILAGELLFIALGGIGLLSESAANNKLISAISSFILLNAAAGAAFWYWATARTDRLWSGSAYTGAIKHAPAPSAAERTHS